MGRGVIMDELRELINEIRLLRVEMQNSNRNNSKLSIIVAIFSGIVALNAIATLFL